MSVINQVLNELEQRGAHGAMEQSMVRAVAKSRRSMVLPILAGGAILVIMFLAWQRWSSKNNNDAPKLATLSAAKIAEGDETPILQNQPASEPTLTEVGMPNSVGPSPSFVTAPRLSLELSSLPLTSIEKSKPTENTPALAEAKSTVSAIKEPTKEMPTMASPASTIVPPVVSAVPMKKVSAGQQADAEFRRAAGLMQQGRIADAIAGYESALHLDANHDSARQALVALFLEAKRNTDAEKVLLDGLSNKPEQTAFTMLLARLQVERGAIQQATATLEKSLPFAETQDDYRAFLAALLQRQNRHQEAITHYQTVVQHASNNGVWLMGYGISLQAVQRNTEAKEMYQRALSTKTLSPELQAFVQQKQKEL